MWDTLLCTVPNICLYQCQVNPILWKDDRLQLALTVDQSLSMDSPQPWQWQLHEGGDICYDISFSWGQNRSCSESEPVSIFTLRRSTAPDIRFDWPEGGVGAADLRDPRCSGVSNICCTGRQDMCTQGEYIYLTAYPCQILEFSQFLGYTYWSCANVPGFHDRDLGAVPIVNSF